MDVFIEAIRRYLGAFLVKLGGLDVLTFSGGIGENSAVIREGVCANLAEFGLVLDPVRNAAAPGEAAVQSDNARVKILIVPADEERIVARATAAVLAKTQGGNDGRERH
jgi:acetate kinase